MSSSPRSIVVVVVAMFACACAPPAPAPSTAPTPVQTAATAPQPADPAPPPATAEPAGQVRVLGRLQRMGDRTCPGGKYGDDFVNAYWTVGLVPLHTTPAQEQELAALRGKPVLVTGTPEAGPPAITRVEPEPCPVMQMRSDWIDSPDGIVMQRRAPPLRGLRLASARAWTGLGAAIAGRHLSVKLEADLGGATLSDAELVVHYEGCYGKPGSQQKDFQLGEIGPRSGAGAATELVRRDGSHDYVAASVELRGRSEGLHVALDVPLGALGVTPPDCP